MTVVGTLYRRLIQLGKVTGAVSFLVAAPYAFAQYLEAREAARSEQTLNLYKMYNAAPVSGYHEKFIRAVTKNSDLLLKAAADEKTFLEAQQQILREDDIEAETLLLFNFFDGVAICVADKLCDSTTAMALFKPRAKEMYLYFYQYMMAKRAAGIKDFGSGVEAIAQYQPEPSYTSFVKTRLVASVTDLR